MAEAVRKPIIVHLCPWPSALSGVQRFIADISNWACSFAHVHILMPYSPLANQDFWKPVMPNAEMHFIKDQRHGERLLASLRPDLIHHHCKETAYLIRGAQAPIIYTNHRYVDFASGNPDSFDVGGTGPLTIKLGVDLTKYKPATTIPKRFIVGIVGRRTPERIPPSFVNALARFPVNPDIVFQFVGKGCNKTDEQIDGVLKGRQNVELIDDVDPSVIHSIYQTFSICLNPASLESAGYAMIEALACGLPIIGRNVQAIPSTIGDAGIIANDDNALLNAVETLYKNKKALTTLSQRARTRAEKLYDINKMYSHYYTAYQKYLRLQNRSFQMPKTPPRNLRRSGPLPGLQWPGQGETAKNAPPERPPMLSIPAQANVKPVNRFIKTASVASIPERENALRQTVNSILPQVDKLYVYLNNYSSVPSFLNHRKIIYARSQDHGDLGDAGKFFCCEKITGYHATIDDDLRYCNDYIQLLKDKIDQYDRKCVVGCLGSWFIEEPIKSYFRSQKGVHTFSSFVKEDKFVNRLGTGCLMYHADTIKPKRIDFKNGFMADVWFAVLAKKQKVPMLVTARNKQLLFPLIANEDDKASLNIKYNSNDSYHTQVVNAVKPWPILTCKNINVPVKRKLGMLLRSDTGGLANISKEFFDHFHPEKSLVLTNVFKGLKEFPEYYKGPGVTISDEHLSTAFLDKWLDGLNVVITFETPYNWDLFKLCKAKGIRSILMVDYEWLADPLPSKPDVLWQPVNWYLEELKHERIPVQYIHMPVNRQRFKYKERKIAKTFLCVFGRAGASSVPNREGIIQIYEALKLVKNKDVRFIFRASKPLPPINDPRVTIDISIKENPEDNYKEGDLVLAPKTFCGMSLSAHEAMSCGMPVIGMADIFPQNRLLPKEWLLKPVSTRPIKLAREIIYTEVLPKQIAEMIDFYAMKDITEESKQANRIANSISWEKKMPQLENLLSPEPKAHSLDIDRSKKKLKIILVGNYKRDWATEFYLALAFESLGHEVLRVQGNENNVDDIFKQSHGCDYFMYSPAFLLEESFSHDGLWLIEQLKKQGTITISYHQDVHLFLNDRDQNVHLKNPFWACDYVFTADGGHDNEFRKRGINHIHLSPGAPEHECYEANYICTFKSDIAFIGTCSQFYFNKQWPFRGRLLEWMKRTYPDNFRLWGPGSGNRPEAVRNQMLNSLYASVKIVIGDSMIADSANKSPSLYWSNRIFEAAGRGGFIIFPKVVGLDSFMTSGKHYVSYDHQNGRLTDFSELKKIIDYYLTHDDEREKIRKAGFLHVKNHHTYKHRMAYMIDLIENDSLRKTKIIVENINPGVSIMRRLCVGSGENPELNPGWENVDIVDFGNNHVHDLEVMPWPFPDNYFDEVKAIDILEHIDKVVPAINEIIRITKPGGQILIQSPNAKYPEYVWIDPEHKRGFADRSFDYWDKSKPLCISYGRSHNKDKFFITNLKVEPLNFNLVFKFNKA